MEADSQQDAEHLKLLSIFHYVVGGIMALLACPPIFHLLFGLAILLGAFDKAKLGERPPEFIGWILIAIRGCGDGGRLDARHLHDHCRAEAGRLRKSYYFCFVVAALLTMFMPFGTVLGVFTIVTLVRPSVKEAFDIPSLNM